MSGFHVFLVLEFCRKAAHNVFNNICLYKPIFFEDQLFGLGEFLVGFTKMCPECNPRFLDRRYTITGLDGLLKFSCLVKNVVCLGDFLRALINIAYHVPVL